MSTTSATSLRFAFTALALLASAFAPACTAFSTDPASSDPASAGPAGGPAADGPKAPVVDGTPNASEITEDFGVFVAPSGRDSASGERTSPLATIQAGIDRGKKVGKRVYVCAGTYPESLTLADSIAVIGGFSCEGSWKPSGVPSRVQSPTSPAVRAKDIVSTTRLEGLDIVAPNAAEPSASSIGLLADHAPGLVLASSSITAGNGAAGVAGVEGIQLVSGALGGLPSVQPFKCTGPSNVGGVVVLGTCTLGVFGFLERPGARAVAGACAGAAGHDGIAGGGGGSGGLWQAASNGTNYVWGTHNSQFSSVGVTVSGLAGASGQDGSASGAFGTLSADGFVPQAGVAGTDGLPGFGGAGGRGSGDGLPATQTVRYDDAYTGMGGASGGAGGCPGLAGTAGTGGGASIAVALIESPIVLDAVTLRTGAGGAGGLGSFGSEPTIGGAPGANLSGVPANAANGGGRGGFAGISTNGSNGPTLGVFQVGAPAVVKGATTIKTGSAAPAIGARSQVSLGTTRTIPATPAGIAKDIFTP